jgi:hypothetical protein
VERRDWGVGGVSVCTVKCRDRYVIDVKVDTQDRGLGEGVVVLRFELGVIPLLSVFFLRILNLKLEWYFPIILCSVPCVPFVPCSLFLCVGLYLHWFICSSYRWSVLV